MAIFLWSLASNSLQDQTTVEHLIYTCVLLEMCLPAELINQTAKLEHPVQWRASIRHPGSVGSPSLPQSSGNER